MTAPKLADLLGEAKSPEQFLRDHWCAEEPLLANATSRLLATLAAIDELQDPEALLKKHRYDVGLFGADAFRSSAPPQVALDFLPQGYNLYITFVERTVPAAARLFSKTACELGVAPWQLRLEAFAGAANGVSSRHYDHDINFQILLRGDKEWVVEKNRQIRNPMHPFHPSRDRNGVPERISEQAFVTGKMPDGFDPDLRRQLRAGTGSVVFLPRGWWHEVRSVNQTWSINLVIRGQTFARGLSQALQMRLHRTAAFRAYIDGLAYGDGTPPPRHQEFEAVKRAAIREIEQITLEEAAVSLAPQSYEWTTQETRIVAGELHARTLDAPVELDAELVPILERLISFEHPFNWEQALAVGQSLGAVGMINLLEELTELGLLREEESRP